MTSRAGRFPVVCLFALVLAACGSGDRSLPVLSFVQAPAIAANLQAPLAFTLTVGTNLNAKISVRLDDGQGHAFSIAFPAQQKNHTVNLLGLRPDRTYSVTVTAKTIDGIVKTADNALQVTTGPLPADFPDITLLLADTARMEPGVTLLDTARKDASAAYLVVVDNAGQVVWYRSSAAGAASRQLPTGGFLTIDPGNGLIEEISMTGEVGTAFHSSRSHPGTAASTPVDVAEFHDDVIRRSSSGSYVTSIADQSMTVNNFPLDENNAGLTGPAVVRDEPIVEFDSTGTLVNRFDFLALLKPTRIGFDATQGLPSAANWADVNSIDESASDGSFIVSLRNQDAVVKFSASDGALKWILGPGANWAGFEQFLLTPAGQPFSWQYHQHGAEVTSAGTILMFDNGNRRASPFTGEPIIAATANNSRAVEYSVDETNMTVSQVWEWGFTQSGESLYAPFAGDADRLAVTGNTLITFGGLCKEAGVASDNIQACRSSARVIEVDTATDERVFDLAVDDADMLSSGYVVNRSERLATLYPGALVVVTQE